MDQLKLEELFSKKAAREYIFDLLVSDHSTMDMIAHGIELLEEWIAEPAAYKTKQERKDALALLKVQEIVEKVFINILTLRSHSTLASMSSQLGLSLGFDDSRQGITLAAEILAIVKDTGLYTIQPLTQNGMWHVIPNITLDPEERLIAERAMFVPPSLVPPLKLKGNRDSGYEYLKGESLILGGSRNHHEGFLCLDVLNIQNAIPLCLSETFLDNVPEERKTDRAALKAKLEEKFASKREVAMAMHQEELNWEMHCMQSNFLYNLIDETGNEFYITNKVDKRGRIYAQGHHISPMGSSFKKSCIELAHKEKINVPKGFF